MRSEEQLHSNIRNFFTDENHKRSVVKGSFLFREGSTANEVYFLQQGRMQISKVIPDGREISLRMTSEGDVIGDFTLFCGTSTHSMNCKALENCTVYSLPKSIFEQKLARNPELTIEWLKWVQLQNRRNETKFRDLILHGKKGALYSTIIRLANSYGKATPDGIVIDLPLTNQELANFCGTSREVVNRLLNELKKEGVLSLEKGYVTLHRLQFLKDSIECEDCPIEVCQIH
ncbi:Crp/Fnr family transcriptional regulator [Bacillus coahuilensis]|uniref:Crp/Fnr family transcriptional regulator n=1 Tax=Bacillus coahuilensis TaxID=408580 RepID=UPI000750399F|nr:Crp/Fnr family transcriptional regulator [Bacillus coahuilensis]